MGIKDSIKKRASRLFYRGGAEKTSEGPNSEPSSNRKSQSRHRKSLSLLSKTSRSEHKVDHEAPQNTNGFLAHPAVQPLEADLTPKTPRLERQRPGIQLEDADEAHTDGNSHGNEYFDASSDQAARQHTTGVENATHQKARPANSPDAEDLERRLSRLAVSQQESELPEIDVDPLTPFDHFEEAHYDQAKLSRLAIGQEGPEKAATHINPLSQESDVNLESNTSQEGNINHNLEAIHPRDAEFDRINKEVQAGTEGGSNFHLQNSLDFDRTVHTDRDPVVHEHVLPHIHEVRQLQRTVSIHNHEHRTLIQPIKDPNPTILPQQHWLQDDKTGEIYKIPDELGKQLM